MGPDGDIVLREQLLKKSLKEQKDYIPIFDEELSSVEGMNRKQRREWYRKNKKNG